MSKPKTVEEKVDEGVQETFPASDPVSVAQPPNTAHEREQRGEAPPVPEQPPRRSADWMLQKEHGAGAADDRRGPTQRRASDISVAKERRVKLDRRTHGLTMH